MQQVSSGHFELQSLTTRIILIGTGGRNGATGRTAKQSVVKIGDSELHIFTTKVDDHWELAFCTCKISERSNNTTRVKQLWEREIAETNIADAGKPFTISTNRHKHNTVFVGTPVIQISFYESPTTGLFR